MLTRVSLLCFAASYLVVLMLEVAKLSPKVRLRAFWIWMWTLAGLVAHTSYLLRRAQEGIAARGVALSSWYHWCLIAAWILVLIYLLISVSRPRSSIGVFFIPLVLILIGLARLLPSSQLFEARHAVGIWGALHGIALLIGTVSVLAGFAAGMMYLIQAMRLKKKKAALKGLKLPSLEWLRQVNEKSLICSVFFLVSGILSGVVLNLTQSSAIAWGYPVIWMSMVLLAWLVAVTLFTTLYKPARFGRKVAYLTIASFVVLALTLSLALFGPSDHIRTIPAATIEVPVASLAPIAPGAGDVR